MSLLDDGEKAERLGRQARKDAEEMFDLRHTLANVEVLYEKVLQYHNKKSLKMKF